MTGRSIEISVVVVCSSSLSLILLDLVIYSVPLVENNSSKMQLLNHLYKFFFLLGLKDAGLSLQN